MRVLHMDVDALVHAVVLQGADHLQSGAIADVREARIFVTAKISLQNAAVFRAIEDRAPGLEFAHPSGRFLGVQLGHPPIVDVLPAAHRVGEMDLPVVAVVHVGERGGDPAFRHHGVRFAEQRFANHPDRHARRRRFDRRAQTGAARADDEDVVGESFVVGHGESAALNVEGLKRCPARCATPNFHRHPPFTREFAVPLPAPAA